MSEVSRATGWLGLPTDGRTPRSNEDFTTQTGCRVRVAPLYEDKDRTQLVLSIDGRMAIVLLTPLECAMLAAALEERS